MAYPYITKPSLDPGPTRPKVLFFISVLPRMSQDSARDMFSSYDDFSLDDHRSVSLMDHRDGAPEGHVLMDSPRSEESRSGASMMDFVVPDHRSPSRSGSSSEELVFRANELRPCVSSSSVETVLVPSPSSSFSSYERRRAPGPVRLRRQRALYGDDLVAVLRSPPRPEVVVVPSPPGSPEPEALGDPGHPGADAASAPVGGRPRARHIFLTIPRTPMGRGGWTKAGVLRMCKAIPNYGGCVIACEKHADGGEHYHIYLRLKRKPTFRRNDYFNQFFTAGREGRAGVNVEVVRSLPAVLRYLTKEDEAPLSDNVDIEKELNGKPKGVNQRVAERILDGATPAELRRDSELAGFMLRSGRNVDAFYEAHRQDLLEEELRQRPPFSALGPVSDGDFGAWHGYGTLFIFDPPSRSFGEGDGVAEPEPSPRLRHARPQYARRATVPFEAPVHLWRHPMRQVDAPEVPPDAVEGLRPLRDEGLASPGGSLPRGLCLRRRVYGEHVRGELAPQVVGRRGGLPEPEVRGDLLQGGAHSPLLPVSTARPSLATVR